MNGSTLTESGFSDGDRRGLTLFGSLLIHLIIILGVGFAATIDPMRPVEYPNLQVVIVNAKSESEPDEASALAQSNLRGSGTQDASDRARSPLPFSGAIDALSLPGGRQSQPQTEANAARLSAPNPAAPVLFVDITPRIPDADRDVNDSPEQPLLASTRSAGEFDQRTSTPDEPRRHRFISTSTREYRFAAYMEEWRASVERVGNLNYPDEARQRNLSGSLILDVAIERDGRIGSIRVVRSSGQKVLDDAAVRIVRYAAPFQPFPASFGDEVDVLHITRTWQFLHNYKLISR